MDGKVILKICSIYTQFHVIYQYSFVCIPNIAKQISLRPDAELIKINYFQKSNTIQ